MEDETVNFFAALVPMGLFVWLIIKATLSAIGGLFGGLEDVVSGGGQQKKKGADSKGLVNVGQTAISNMHSDADSKIKSRVK